MPSAGRQRIVAAWMLLAMIPWRCRRYKRCGGDYVRTRSRRFRCRRRDARRRSGRGSRSVGGSGSALRIFRAARQADGLRLAYRVRSSHPIRCPIRPNVHDLVGPHRREELKPYHRTDPAPLRVRQTHALPRLRVGRPLPVQDSLRRRRNGDQVHPLRLVQRRGVTKQPQHRRNAGLPSWARGGRRTIATVVYPQEG